MLKCCAFALRFLGCTLAAPLAAQDAATFYKDKTIAVLNGFGPGGSNDIWARSIARHMGKHLPGNPRFVNQNMPGAGTLTLANHLGVAAVRDGSVFGVISKGIPLEPLFGGKGVQFDPLAMTWIGSPDRDTNVCVARKDSKVQTMNDLITTELIVGATGSGADTAVYPEFLRELLGVKLKTIKGYPGSTDVMLGIERKELDGICVSYVSIARHRMYLDGNINIILQAGFERDPAVPASVPMALDLAKTPNDKATLTLFASRAALGRPFVAPPGLPIDRAEALRKAFDETMKDKDFILEVEKQGLAVEPIGGEALAQMLAEIYRTPKNVVSAVSQVLTRISQ